MSALRFVRREVSGLDETHERRRERAETEARRGCSQ
jgi:hypothetical protein